MAFFSGLRRVLDPSEWILPQAMIEGSRRALPSPGNRRMPQGVTGPPAPLLVADALGLHPILGPHGQARVDAALEALMLERDIVGSSDLDFLRGFDSFAATGGDQFGRASAETSSMHRIVPAPPTRGHDRIPVQTADPMFVQDDQGSRETMTRLDQRAIAPGTAGELALNSDVNVSVNPQTQGLNAGVERLVRGNASAGEVARYLRSFGLDSDFIKDTIAQYRTLQQWRRQYPDYAGPFSIDLERLSRPLTPGESAIATVARGPIGAYSIAAGNAATGNHLDNLVELTGGDGDLANRGMAMVREQNPVSSFLGDVAGSASIQSIGRQAAGRLIGRGVQGAFSLPGIGADVVTGAYIDSGANGTDLFSLEDSAVGALFSAGTGGLGRGVSGAGRFAPSPAGRIARSTDMPLPSGRAGTTGASRSGRVGSRQGTATQGRPSSPKRRSSLTGRSSAPFEIDPREVERYMQQGYSHGAAKYLAEPYFGMGEHFIARKHNLPKWFTDSRFNVLIPPNITRGQMYELHYRVDPRFHGANLPKRFGDRSWSGGRAGLQKYGPAGRLWFGSPRPLKIAVGGTGGAVGGGAYLVGDEEDD
ncbi:hypothetical protein [Sphingosinicella terrae]|uniref:hypothetical protein n=1 Tax=Sphingosinicella terrae TaxID=2172047 RepID=UPI0013B4189F|nr:hypothetical protein [Sphingosinicella terrae]